jgi:hypothetical protein
MRTPGSILDPGAARAEESNRALVPVAPRA